MTKNQGIKRQETLTSLWLFYAFRQCFVLCVVLRMRMPWQLHSADFSSIIEEAKYKSVS